MRPLLAIVIVAVLHGWASAAPRPSAGCGRASPPTGALTIASQGGPRDYIVSIPPGYDPRKPYPLGFAFHGLNRTHVDCRDEDCHGFKSVVARQAVVVYLKSIGKGWQGPEGSKNLPLFADVLAHMKKSYCIDEGRVFVAGTSSGAGFVNELACRMGDQLLAVAPVHGRIAHTTGCKGHPAVINIHGIADKLIPRAAGEEARDFFAARNACQGPDGDLGALHARIQKARDARQTALACLDYRGCAKAPVRWCVHSEPGYEDLNHEWPSDGGKVIWDFVAAR